MPYSKEERKWSIYLITSSRGRPRDAIQLVIYLASSANLSKRDKINSYDVEKTSFGYSKDRVDDVSSENTDLCDQISNIIRTFKDVEFREKAEKIKLHLQRLPSVLGIRVCGSTLQPNAKDDLFKIWEVLFKIGFINARVDDIRRERGFRLICIDEDSTLVSAGRWNDMQKYDWEIHPCYRSFLIKLRNDDLAAKRLY